MAIRDIATVLRKKIAKKNCGKIVRFYQTGCLSILTACDEAYNKLRG